METLQIAIDVKPAATCFAAVESKAVISLQQKSQAAKVPVIGLTCVWTATFLCPLLLYTTSNPERLSN